MTKELQEEVIKKHKKHNIRIYYIYKAISWDLLFYYAVSFIFLNAFKGLSPAEIVFADAFFPLYKVLFQIPAALLVNRIGKKNCLIVGNTSLFVYMIFVLGCNTYQIMIIANIFMALGFVLKNLCESNILYDSLQGDPDKLKKYSKIEGRSSALYYYLGAFSSIVAGLTYNINPYIPMCICMGFVITSIICSYLFKEVPIDLTNPNEEHGPDESLFKRIKHYRKDMKNAFKFIFSSSRLKGLIMFNAIFASMVLLLTSYRRSLLGDIGITATQIGFIFAVLELICGLTSSITIKVHRQLRNKALTYLGLYYAFSIIISGLVVYLNIPFALIFLFVLFAQVIQFAAKGPYYTLIKQYLSSFASPSMRIKIFAANSMIEGIVACIFSLFGAWILTFNDTARASILIGSIFFILFIFILEYMRTRVGLKPEEYEPEEIHFKEVE